MAYQAEGVLHKVFDTEQKSDKFRTREFILEISESQYPQLIKFQLTQDKCEIIDDYSAGDVLTIHFDLRGREWNERFFTNLQCWKIETASGTSSESESPVDRAPSPTKQPTANAQQNAFDDEDIPF